MVSELLNSPLIVSFKSGKGNKNKFRLKQTVQQYVRISFCLSTARLARHGRQNCPQLHLFPAQKEAWAEAGTINSPGAHISAPKGPVIVAMNSFARAMANWIRRISATNFMPPSVFVLLRHCLVQCELSFLSQQCFCIFLICKKSPP